MIRIDGFLVIIVVKLLSVKWMIFEGFVDYGFFFFLGCGGLGL